MKTLKKFLTILTAVSMILFTCSLITVSKADEVVIGFNPDATCYTPSPAGEPHFRLELTGVSDAKTQFGGFEKLPSAIEGKTNGDLIYLTGIDGTAKTVNEWKTATGTQAGDTNQYIRQISTYGTDLFFIVDTAEAQKYFVKIKIEKGVLWYVGSGANYFWNRETPSSEISSATTQQVTEEIFVKRQTFGSDACWKDGAVSADLSVPSYGNSNAGNPHFRLAFEGVTDAKTQFGGFEKLPSGIEGQTNGDLIFLTGIDGVTKSVNLWKGVTGTQAGDTNQYIRQVSVYGNEIVFIVDAKEAQKYFTGVTVKAGVKWYVGQGGGAFWGTSAPNDIVNSLNTIVLTKDFSVTRSLGYSNPYWNNGGLNKNTITFNYSECHANPWSNTDSTNWAINLDGAADASGTWLGLENLSSAVDGKTNGDLLYLVGKDGVIKTVNEWKTTLGTKNQDTNQYVRSVGVFGTKLIVICDTAESVDYFTRIIIKSGFKWYVGGPGGTMWNNNVTDSSFGSFPITATVNNDISAFRNVVTNDYSWINSMPEYTVENGKIVVEQDALTVSSQPEKITYSSGENFDFSGLKLEYKTAEGTTVELNSEKIEDAFNKGYLTVSSDGIVSGGRTFAVLSENKNIDIIVSYGGAKTVISVYLTSDSITAVEVLTEPTSTSVEINGKPDYSGLSLKVKSSKNPDGVEMTYIGNKANFVMGDCDTSTAGTKKVKCSYLGIVFSLTFTVTDSNPDKCVTVNLNSSAYKNEYDSAIVEFKFVGYVPVNLPNILWCVDVMPNVADKILINGKTIAELRAEDKDMPTRIIFEYDD